MHSSLISLGANLGNVRETMQSAKRLLEDAFGQANLKFSHLYRTPPVGGPSGQQDFLNAVVAIESSRSAWEIWESVKQIESALGRHRLHRWEARRIDIDLLLHGTHRIWTPHLKVPHPRMCMRSFVLKPAQEIVPDWLEPVTGWTIQQLSDHLDRSRSNSSTIRIISENASHLEQLQYEFAKLASSHPLDLAWEVRQPRTEWKPQLSSSTQLPTKLTIVATASPDPTTIHWEDVSSDWVGWLNLVEQPADAMNLPNRIAGPRYLMPSNDLAWAAHEIFAAQAAMESWVLIDSLFS
jgi:2-amino-4-hydroxy-6-hydroxymethyldihydropteridine diphosphokinase